MSDLIDRQEAIDYINSLMKWSNDVEACIDILQNTPSMTALDKDGTLRIDTADYPRVKRVLVEHGTSGTLFYADDEMARPITINFAHEADAQMAENIRKSLKNAPIMIMAVEHEGKNCEGCVRPREFCGECSRYWDDEYVGGEANG